MSIVDPPTQVGGLPFSTDESCGECGEDCQCQEPSCIDCGPCECDCEPHGSYPAQTLEVESQIFSPWFPRQGDNLRATADILELGSNTVVSVRLFTKKHDSSGDGKNVDPTVVLRGNSTGRFVAEWGPWTIRGLQSLVRYQMTVETTGGRQPATFRILHPIWFDSIREKII